MKSQHYIMYFIVLILYLPNCDSQQLCSSDHITIFLERMYFLFILRIKKMALLNCNAAPSPGGYSVCARRGSHGPVCLSSGLSAISFCLSVCLSARQTVLPVCLLLGITPPA